jgi:hypothetical protein
MHGTHGKLTKYQKKNEGSSLMWNSSYRSITPKARLIRLSDPFLSYLRADGIILPPDEHEQRAQWSDSDSGVFSSTENPTGAENDNDEEEAEDPSRAWSDVHASVKATIDELGGKIVPKLNWSAPKDATWISSTNSMECRTPNDVYLLLKSSDFITHDLEHAFDDCEPDDEIDQNDIPFHLVLRKYILLNPSMEFRCFVRRRRLVGICQRDLNHFEFLFAMRDDLRNKIVRFFEEKLRDTFPEENFAFDVYIPPPHERVWLVDINPWAKRTDPLLFSWLELLTMSDGDSSGAEQSWRLELRTNTSISKVDKKTLPKEQTEESRFVKFKDVDSNESSDSDSDAEEIFTPEFRLIQRDDPEAYAFSTPQYSAHKLPLEVVNASSGAPGALENFASQWREMLEQQKREEEEEEESSSSSDG